MSEGEASREEAAWGECRVINAVIAPFFLPPTPDLSGLPIDQFQVRTREQKCLIIYREPLEAWPLGTEKGYTRFYSESDGANAEHDSKESPMKNIQLVPTLQEQ